jgi:hypothetical protein
LKPAIADPLIYLFPASTTDSNVCVIERLIICIACPIGGDTEKEGNARRMLTKQQFLARFGGKFNLFGTRWANDVFRAVREPGDYKGSYVWSIWYMDRFRAIVSGDETNPFGELASAIDNIRKKEA